MRHSAENDYATNRLMLAVGNSWRSPMVGATLGRSLRTHQVHATINSVDPHRHGPSRSRLFLGRSYDPSTAAVSLVRRSGVAGRYSKLLECDLQSSVLNGRIMGALVVIVRLLVAPVTG